MVEKAYNSKIIDMFATKSLYLDVTYVLSDFLFAFMFMRCFFLIRTLLNMSIYSDLYSKRVCAKYSVQASPGF